MRLDLNELCMERSCTARRMTGQSFCREHFDEGCRQLLVESSRSYASRLQAASHYEGIVRGRYEHSVMLDWPRAGVAQEAVYTVVNDPLPVHWVGRGVGVVDVSRREEGRSDREFARSVMGNFSGPSAVERAVQEVSELARLQSMLGAVFTGHSTNAIDLPVPSEITTHGAPPDVSAEAMQAALEQSGIAANQTQPDTEDARIPRSAHGCDYLTCDARAVVGGRYCPSHWFGCSRPGASICAVAGCFERSLTEGICNEHFDEWRGTEHHSVFAWARERAARPSCSAGPLTVAINLPAGATLRRSRCRRAGCSRPALGVFRYCSATCAAGDTDIYSEHYGRCLVAVCEFVPEDGCWLCPSCDGSDRLGVELIAFVTAKGSLLCIAGNCRNDRRSPSSPFCVSHAPL
jgi:hypothetical protein